MKINGVIEDLFLVSGDYRPLAPKYGEYKYLPPQRWIHALKVRNVDISNHTIMYPQYGAVVFLYHPCAPLEQVMTLKDIAKSCLRKHIITSYPELSIDKVQMIPDSCTDWIMCLLLFCSH